MVTLELSGSVSDKDKGFIETWENVGQQVNYVIRENRRGDEEHVEIAGAKKFKLSTYDRMLTEDKIINDRLNPFKNGSFRPITVPHDVSIDSNPNAMSTDDIRELFIASNAAWDEYMDVINSPSTLQRMIDLANVGDVELSHRRFRQLEYMIEQFSNINTRIVQKDQAQFDAMGSPGASPISGGSMVEQVAAPRRGRPPKLVN